MKPDWFGTKDEDIGVLLSIILLFDALKKMDIDKSLERILSRHQDFTDEINEYLFEIFKDWFIGSHPLFLYCYVR